MTVVVDTGVIVGAINADDPLHRDARALLARILLGEFGTPITSDYVLDEALTLFRRRPGRVRECRALLAVFMGEGDTPPPLVLRETRRKDVDRAVTLFFRHFERGLSFTDCVIAGIADELDATVASFDGGFDGVVSRCRQ